MPTQITEKDSWELFHFIAFPLSKQLIIPKVKEWVNDEVKFQHILNILKQEIIFQVKLTTINTFEENSLALFAMCVMKKLNVPPTTLKVSHALTA